MFHMRFQIKSYEIEKPKGVELKKELSLVVLGDLHLKQYGARQEQLLWAIKNCDPDAVLITGDLLMGLAGHDLTPARDLLLGLVPQMPVICVDGNHELHLQKISPSGKKEYDSFCEDMKAAGVQWLDNQMYTCPLCGIPVHFYGLSLPKKYYKRFCNVKLSLEEIETAIGCPAKDGINILLCHTPRFAETFFQWGADLTVCGHYHGGIARIAGRGLIGPDGKILYRYSYGHHEKDQHHLVVTSGIGEHHFPIRIWNPRELMHITIK